MRIDGPVSNWKSAPNFINLSVNVCESVPQFSQVRNMDKPILTKLAAEAGLVNSIQKPNCFVFRLFLAPEFEVLVWEGSSTWLNSLKSQVLIAYEPGPPLLVLWHERKKVFFSNGRPAGGLILIISDNYTGMMWTYICLANPTHWCNVQVNWLYKYLQ